MKSFAGILALALIVVAASVGSAHEPPGEVYYVPDVPLGAITVDGDLSDWDVVPDIYWITLVDHFEETVRGIGTDFDLADFNAVVKNAWCEENNRLYHSADLVDDHLHNYRENVSRYDYDDGWHLILDADHGGGDLFGDGWRDLPLEEQRELFYTEGQLYQILVPPIEGYWDFMYIEETNWWLVTGQDVTGSFPYPDYLDIGWSRTGETRGPGTYTFEFMHTPWDWMDWDGPEASTIVTLEEGLIIHMAYMMKDWDETEGGYEGSYDFPPVHNCWRNANLNADFELVKDPSISWPTAVQTDTWGRIKASMLE
jgi:hypothetical protein